jgi:hypothetical protein
MHVQVRVMLHDMRTQHGPAVVELGQTQFQQGLFVRERSFQVRRRDHDAHTILRQSRQRGTRLLDGLRAIIDGGNQMVVKINHARNPLRWIAWPARRRERAAA